MTASYSPKPQRQVRKSVADPAKKADPAGVDRPPQVWQRLGGQLIDNRTYDGLVQPQRDTMSAIENFIGQEGGYTKTSEWANRDYQEKILEEVNKVYKKTAEAEVTNSLINDEVEKLNAVNATQEAEDLLRRNNLADHFWNIKDAEEASVEVTVGLEVFGTQNAGALAGLNTQQRSALIQKKKAELLKPYAGLPEGYLAAYVEPKLAVADKSIKEAVLKEEFKLTKLQNENLAFKTITTGFKNAAIYNDIANSEGLKELSGFSSEKLQKVYTDGKAAFIKHNPLYVSNGKLTKAGEKVYHQMWFDYAPRLFLNEDGDNYNDVATHLHFGQYWKALEKVKTSDGTSILDINAIVDGKKVSLKNTLFFQMNNAIRNRTILENMAEQEENNAAKEAEDDVEKDYVKNFKNLNTKLEHDAYRTKVKNRFLDEEGDYINIPPGYTGKEWMEKIDKLIPEFFKYEAPDVTRDNKTIINNMLEDQPFADLDDIQLDMSMSAYGFDGTYGEFFETIKNGASHKYLLTQTANNSTQAAGQVNTLTETLTTNIVDGLEENMKLKSPAYLELSNLKPDKQKLAKVNGFIEEGADAAGLLLAGEAKKFIRQELLKLEPHERLLPENQSRILADAKRLFYEQPIYSDISLWRNINPADPKTFGQVQTIPIGGVDKWEEGTGWVNGVPDDYDLKNWAYIARPTFVRGDSGSQAGKENALNYLSNNFVLSDKSLDTLNEFLVTGDLTKISPELEKDLNLIKLALDNNLTRGEIVKAQMGRLYSKGKGPIINEDNYNLLNEVTETPVAQTGNKARDESLFVYEEYLDSKEGIEFKVQLNNGVQTSNNIASPFSGRVISVNNYENSGLTVLLESDTDNPGAPKGTRVVIRHCGSTQVKEGDYLSKGNSLCIAGVHSLLPNGGEGSTTGNDIDAGHVVMQFLYPGTELTEDGEAGMLSVEWQEQEIPEGFYQSDDDPITEISGLIPLELQRELFGMHLQPYYQRKYPFWEERLDLDESDIDSNLNYTFPLTTD